VRFSRCLEVGSSDVNLYSFCRSYFTIIKAGRINFRVALDTASSDLWLFSSSCTTDTCKQSPRYPLSYQSPTFSSINNNDTAFDAHYADDTCTWIPPTLGLKMNLIVVVLANHSTVASGFVARETLEVANLTIPNQEFGKRQRVKRLRTD